MPEAPGLGDVGALGGDAADGVLSQVPLERRLLGLGREECCDLAFVQKAFARVAAQGSGSERQQSRQRLTVSVLQ
jgi:hypothetical protein